MPCEENGCSFYSAFLVIDKQMMLKEIINNPPCSSIMRFSNNQP